MGATLVALLECGLSGSPCPIHLFETFSGLSSRDFSTLSGRLRAQEILADFFGASGPR